MTDTDTRMNPVHFGSNLADIQMRIDLDSNPGSLLVEILALAEADHSLVVSYWEYYLPM